MREPWGNRAPERLLVYKEVYTIYFLIRFFSLFEGEKLYKGWGVGGEHRLEKHAF